MPNGAQAKAGIGKAIANFGRLLRDKKLREEEERRREEERQRRAEQERLNLGLRLAQVGGGTGAAPQREREIAPPPQVDTDFEVPESTSPQDAPGFQAPEGPLTREGTAPGPGLRDPRGLSGPGLQPDPDEITGSASMDAPPVPTATARETDPDYREIESPTTGEALAYYKTPGAREREALERQDEFQGPDWELRTGPDGGIYRVSPTRGVGKAVAGISQPEKEEPTITVGNREFPDTPEGRQEALDWRRRYAGAGRRPEEDDEAVIRMAGRTFPDTPEGRDAALEWRAEYRAAGRDADDWTPPPGMASLVEDREDAVDLYGEEIVSHYDRTGEWNPSIGEGGGGPDPEGPGAIAGDEEEGPLWYKRAISDAKEGVSDFFSGGETAAEESRGPGPDRPSYRHRLSASGDEGESGRRRPGAGAPPGDEPLDQETPDEGMGPLGDETMEEATSKEGDQASRLETDIQEALDEGQTPIEIINELRDVGAPENVIQQARSILREREQ